MKTIKQFLQARILPALSLRGSSNITGNGKKVVLTNTTCYITVISSYYY